MKDMNISTGATINTELIERVVEDLKELLLKYTDIDDAKIDESLYSLFGKVETDSGYKVENLVEFVFFAASLYELKARALMHTGKEIDWTDEISILKDRDLAFNRLLQFKAFSEVGLACASKIQKEEKSVPVFKSYMVPNDIQHNILIKNIEYDQFESTAEEVFNRFNTIQGFSHIDIDLPDIQESINEFIIKVNSDMQITFEEIISNGTYEDAIAYFLALLETVRWGIVSATQDDMDSSIKIEKNE